jgi:hypothetical protein
MSFFTSSSRRARVDDDGDDDGDGDDDAEDGGADDDDVAGSAAADAGSAVDIFTALRSPGKFATFGQKQGYTTTTTTTQPCFFELFSLKSLGHSPAPEFFLGGY